MVTRMNISSAKIRIFPKSFVSSLRNAVEELKSQTEMRNDVATGNTSILYCSFITREIVLGWTLINKDHLIIYKQ